VPLAARGGLPFFARAKKGNPKKARPGAAETPALLAPAGREPNSPSAKTALGSDTGSRNLPAEAAMLGGGYGSRYMKGNTTSYM